MESISRSDVIVSICCITYNHEKYIHQAINGFLMQKTDFEFEILINDDASTDNTTKIIKQYEIKYPDKIKPICHKENEYRKGKNPCFNNYKRAKGKYLALCEGDDYWTDEYKLQKQIDFLEANSEYSATYHNIIVIDENNCKKHISEYNFQKRSKEISLRDYYRNNLYVIGHTSSLLLVNFFKHFTEIDYERINNCSATGDRIIFMDIMFRGKVYYMNDIMSVYRHIVSSGSSYMAENYKKNGCKRHYLSTLDLISYAKDCYQVEIPNAKQIIESQIIYSIIYAIKNPTKENIDITKWIINDYGKPKMIYIKFLILLLYRLLRKLLRIFGKAIKNVF